MPLRIPIIGVYWMLERFESIASRLIARSSDDDGSEQEEGDAQHKHPRPPDGDDLVDTHGGNAERAHRGTEQRPRL